MIFTLVNYKYSGILNTWLLFTSFGKKNNNNTNWKRNRNDTFNSCIHRITFIVITLKFNQNPKRKSLFVEMNIGWVWILQVGFDHFDSLISWHKRTCQILCQVNIELLELFQMSKLGFIVIRQFLQFKF